MVFGVNPLFLGSLHITCCSQVITIQLHPEFSYRIWRSPSLSELTSIIFYMELTHLGLDASIYTNNLFCFFIKFYVILRKNWKRCVALAVVWYNNTSHRDVMFEKQKILFFF